MVGCASGGEGGWLRLVMRDLREREGRAGCAYEREGGLPANVREEEAEAGVSAPRCRPPPLLPLGVGWGLVFIL